MKTFILTVLFSVVCVGIALAECTTIMDNGDIIFICCNGGVCTVVR